MVPALCHRLATVSPRHRAGGALSVALLVAVTSHPSLSYARNVEAGEVRLSAALGPGIKMGGRLGASGGYFGLGGQGEYALSKHLGVIGDLTLGLAGTVPLRLRAGARYRFADLQLPVSPYAQAQLSYGYLVDVLNTNLHVLGVRLGGGADYFLTKNLGVGALLALDWAGTLHDNSSTYAVTELFVYASYQLMAPAAPSPTTAP